MTHSASPLRRGLCTLTAIAGLSLSASAAATSVDEVQLVDGGMVRGSLIEVAPGQRVILQVPGEPQPRIIPWAQVRDVKQAREPGLEGVEVTPERDVFLHVEADDPNVEIHSIQSVTAGYVGTDPVLAVQTKLECQAPCDRRLPTNGRYFFSGVGITPSPVFTLDEGWEGAEVDVNAGSAGLQVGGAWVGALGLTAASTGAVLVALGYALDDDRVGSEQYHDYRTAGFVTLGVGIAVLVGGIVMITQSFTEFELHPETTRLGGVELPTGRFAF